MRRFLALGCMFVFSISILTGCDGGEYQKQELQAEIESLEEEIEELESIRDGLISKDDVVYIVEIEISQSHFSLDIEDHLKDSMNAITIPIEVSQEYYYSVEKGDILNSDLRVGSMVFKGSFGSWNIVVKDKQKIVNAEE